MTASQPEDRRLGVLVVDDERLIRWSVSATLRAAGHTVAEADCAASALSAVGGGATPDVVLLDFRMPDSADLGLLARIRTLLPKSAVILMTAFGTPDVVEAALGLGAAQVLNKPFDLATLESVVLAADAHARAFGGA